MLAAINVRDTRGKGGEGGSRVSLGTVLALFVRALCRCTIGGLVTLCVLNLEAMLPEVTLGATPGNATCCCVYATQVPTFWYAVGRLQDIRSLG